MSTSPSVLDDRRADVPAGALAALTGPDGRFASGPEDVLGTTTPVFTHRQRNLPGVMEAAAAAHPERPFVVDAAAAAGADVLTYGEARELIVRRAGQLAAQGVRPGDRSRSRPPIRRSTCSVRGRPSTRARSPSA